MDLKLRLLLVFVVVGIFTHEIIAADQPQPCMLPTQPGTCRAYMKRYAYNSASGQCEEFIYTGCRGNENNFKSMPECEATCIMNE